MALPLGRWALAGWLIFAPCLITPTTWAAPLTESALASQRRAFVDAERALLSGDTVRLRALSVQLHDYPLYPYLRYRELSRSLATSDARTVRRFLADFADTPLAPRLRGEWLRLLADQSRWDDIVLDYRPDSDLELSCIQRTALLQQQRTAQALAGFDAAWLGEKTLPGRCDPVVQAWATQGGLTPAMAWQRFTIGMQAGSTSAARQALPWLDPEDQDWARLWLAVDQNPALILQDSRLQASGDEHVEMIVAHGLMRWMNRDSVAAAPAVDEIRRRRTVTEEQLLPIERTLAIYMAARQHPDALRRIDAIPTAYENDTLREWRVRLYLLRGNWRATIDAIEHMPPAQLARPAWRYWRARALEGIGERSAADIAYRELASLRDYYGFLAASHTSQRPAMTDHPVAKPLAAMQTLASLPAVNRARELFLLGRPYDARSEWALVMDNADPQRLRAAALLVADWGWAGQAILWLAKAGDWNDLALRFPLPWRNEVESAAHTTRLSPAWLYAIARQESTFQPEVRSPADARGLMQLLPSTAVDVARGIGMRLNGSSSLYDPSINLKLGSIHLRQLLDRFDGNMVTATAAYNAGENRIRDWLPSTDAVDADIWVETIPFVETRNYVKRVWEYTAVFEYRLGLPVQGLTPNKVSSWSP